MNTVNSDILLDPLTNDLLVSNFDLSIATDSTATAQRLAVGLKVFLGEWFLDRTFGIDYYQYVFIKDPNLTVISQLLKEYILSVPFVESISEFNIDFNEAQRTIAIDFKIIDSDDDIVSVSLTIP